MLHYSKNWYSIMLVNQAISIMRVNSELAIIIIIINDAEI